MAKNETCFPLAELLLKVTQKDGSVGRVLEIDTARLEVEIQSRKKEIDERDRGQDACSGCLNILFDPFGIQRRKDKSLRVNSMQHDLVLGITEAVSLTNKTVSKIAEEQRSLINGVVLETNTNESLEKAGYQVLDQKVSLPDGNEVFFFRHSELENHHGYDKRTSLFISAKDGRLYCAQLISVHDRNRRDDVNFSRSIPKIIASRNQEVLKKMTLDSVQMAMAENRRVGFGNVNGHYTVDINLIDFDKEDDLLMMKAITMSSQNLAAEVAYDRGLKEQKRNELRRDLGIEL